MFKNFQVSKETEDKVKLAKQCIQRTYNLKLVKYHTILQQERKQKQGWERVMKALAQAPLHQTQKKEVVQKMLGREASQARLSRMRDKLSNYKLYQMIGKGAFGDVRLAKIKATGEVVAIKRMAKQKIADKKQISSVFLERDCLSCNRSGWLVELRSAFQDDLYLYIAMTWVPGGDLLRLLIQRDIFSENDTRFYVAELILALQDMHKMNYIHRDIKPDNILIDHQGHLKLTDFGLSKYLEAQPKTRGAVRNSFKPRQSLKRLAVPRQRHFSKVGTPDYIAPQVLTEQTYDQRVDIWSVGVIMFECLFGYPLFSHEDSKEVCQRVMNWEEYLIFPDTPRVSIQAKMLILGMLSSPQNRLTIPQIKNHSFFSDYNWERIRSMAPPFVPVVSHDLDTGNFDAFENEEPWVDHQRKPERKSHEIRSSSQGYQYNFAGFDWQPRPRRDSFSETIKQIESLGKQKSVALKRLKTQQSRHEQRQSPEIKLIRHSMKMFQKPKKQGKVVPKVGLYKRA